MEPAILAGLFGLLGVVLGAILQRRIAATESERETSAREAVDRRHRLDSVADLLADVDELLLEFRRRGTSRGGFEKDHTPLEASELWSAKAQPMRRRLNQLQLSHPEMAVTEAAFELESLIGEIAATAFVLLYVGDSHPPGDEGFYQLVLDLVAEAEATLAALTKFLQQSAWGP